MPSRNWIEHVVSAQAVVRTRFVCKRTHPVSTRECQLVSNYLSIADHSTDVRFDFGIPHQPLSWPRACLQSRCWHWNIAQSYSFVFASHINALELRTILLSVLWRARRPGFFRSRFLHLSDSQAALAIASKGRSGSKVLRPIIARLNAVILASDAYPLWGFFSPPKTIQEIFLHDAHCTPEKENPQNSRTA